MAESLSLGVDWSSGSWFAVAFERTGFAHAGVYDEIGELWHRYEEVADSVFVDIPIGLIEEGEEGRECDTLARRVLGPRSRSVFTPPVREATRRHSYKAAKRVNERKSGRSLSKQTFNISESIAEVDDLLRNVPEAREAFVESHPEVCFRALAGEPLQHSKRKAGGYAERMRTLATFDADAPAVVQSAAEAAGDAEVAIDDVLDATVLAYAARASPEERYTLPPDPPTDAKGLPMQIAYRASSPLVE
ncbi:DUF429 domain-containing protein [Salinibaculum rarum]|uniref:DUF429 domain-containing protein n=1 Tax=Salinibaculum rarum TaxID=3058903 RepID=UPI00265E86B7|nr:DUF429 domain-containing protein [Salinibaculum sp. KK48]